jgi:hypothetical protein
MTAKGKKNRIVPSWCVFLQDDLSTIDLDAAVIPNFFKWFGLVHSFDKAPPINQINIFEIIIYDSLNNIIHLVAYARLIFDSAVQHFSCVRH